MIGIFLTLVLAVAIAEAVVALWYVGAVDKYAALTCEIEAAEKRLRDIDKAVPAYLTAADLDSVADYIDLAFWTQLYDIAGNDPQRNDILKAQQLAVDAFKALAARRREEGSENEVRDRNFA
jgi:hypothetical protein